MIQICVISREKHDLNKIISLLSAQEDFIITGTGHSGYDAIKTVSGLRPDIIIMDLCMDDISGTELAPIIRRKSPAVKLIAISSRDDALWIRRALRAGFAGFLFKQFDLDKLANAVRTVLYGGYYLSKVAKNHAYKYLPEMDSLVISDPAPPVYAVEAAVPPDVSDTERRILTQIAKGHSDKEIAEELHIAIGTVRNCLAAIKRKTGQKNRTQMVIYSLIHGLIDIPLKT